MDAPTRLDQGWLGRITAIGADPNDSDEVRLRKALLVIVCLLILPISILWGAIYLALGVWAGLIAWLYTLISLVAIAVFSRTRDIDWLVRVELGNILLAPTVSMAFVGGFVASGAVGLWGILAPLGALIFSGAAAGVRWFVAFALVFVVSGAVGEVAGLGPPLPAWFPPLMIALNITVGGAVVFGLLVQFVRQREEAVAALRVEQDRAETLLLNILPRSIADKLKADASTIADHFAAASILFADIVDFTPFSERLQPAQVVDMLDHLFTHFDNLADRFGDPWWRASSAANGSCTTCGATRSTWRAAWRPTARRAGSRSRARRTSCFVTSSSWSRGARWRSRARATSRRGT